MLLLAALPGRVAVGADWPCWRGPELNGISREADWSVAWPAEGPKRLWQAEVGTGFSSVVVSQGRLYTLGNTKIGGVEQDTVYCLDAATGAMIWKHAYPCPLDAKYNEGGPYSTPTVDGNRVYTFSKRGHLFCFATTNGQVLWWKNLMEELGVHKPTWGFAGSPLVIGGRVLLNVGRSGTAVQRATGRVLWSSGTNAAGYATPVPLPGGRDPAALIFAEKDLFAVRVGDGRVLWNHPWKSPWDINAADPIVAGDRVYLSSLDRSGTLLKVGPNGPSVVWSNRLMGNQFSQCVLWQDHLYGIDGNTDTPTNALRCVDFRTGAVRWSQSGLGLGQPLLANGYLVVLSDSGELVVAPAAPEGFKPVARAQVLTGKCWTPPVLANGRLYCRNARGLLVCLSLK